MRDDEILLWAKSIVGGATQLAFAVGFVAGYLIACATLLWVLACGSGKVR